MADNVESIKKKISSFQKKYYLDIFIKGCILTFSALCFYFLSVTLLEYTLWLGQWVRLLIFVAFFILVSGCIYIFLWAPLTWFLTRKGLGLEQSAKIIGQSSNKIQDRLLNLIQLASSNTSDLGLASIQQKSDELSDISFDSFIQVSSNKKYVKYLALPVGVLLLIFVVNKSIITQSTTRLIHFNQEYTPEAPFAFRILNSSLTAYYNENFTVTLRLEGNALPENVYLTTSHRVKMEPGTPGIFSYTFENVQDDFKFQLEGAGFHSKQYEVTVIRRPELIKFGVDLDYPAYLQRKDISLANTGNLEVPEGTVVKWKLNTLNTTKASIVFSSTNLSSDFVAQNEQGYTLSKKFLKSDQYQILLQNDKSNNKEKILYQVDVIKDEFPNIVVNNFKDSIVYKRIVIGGSIGDDYGLTQLMLCFTVKNQDQKEILKSNINIPVSRNQIQQNFFYYWALDSIKLKPGEQLDYYLKVWDNDGVNGRKFTRSGSYTFQIPTEDNLITEIDKSRKQTEQRLDQSNEKAKKLQDRIEDAYQKLKGKQSLDWQDKKMLEDIIEEKEKLDQTVDQVKEQNKLLQEKKDAFTEQDIRIKEKADQIQKLMNELLDEETKKLFDELQKLLKENSDTSQIQKLLDKLNQNVSNLEKELDRMLELFKEVEYETKLDLAIQKLKNQVEKQKSLLDKTNSLNKDGSSKKNDANDESTQDLAKEQDQLQKDFEKTAEKIEELKKIQNELGKDDELPSQEKSNEIKNDQQKSKESLEQGKPSKAKESQQKALEKMQQMQQQMEGMQNAMEMETEMENIESLRQIIHGLIKLSFDQESIIKKFGDLQQNDPQFNTLAQQQLKLRDDAKVLEDSLLSISKKDIHMNSFVIKEIGNLNGYLNKVIDSNKERRRPQALNEMQLTMTSINNLALMLDDHYDMMMQMLSKAKSSMKMSKKKGKQPSLSQMQQQLNEKIQQLKNSGKSGRQLSEELAESAAEQERIRKALQEMQEKMKNAGKNPGGDINSKMEQSELDLVNKQLSDQLIRRQKEILTRMLETEKSMREQDMDEERKGETAKDYEKEIPKAFEEYLRLKEKEVELLKTMPPKLYPYYRKEVNDYFKRIGN